MKEFRADMAAEGERADIFIAKKYPKYTRSSLDVLFDQGLVLANGKPVRQSYRLKPDDMLSVDETLLKKKPKKIKLPVVFENNDAIVIDKPAGLLTHSKGAINLEPTIASFIHPNLSKDLSGNRAGIVHRLDRATSGLIITAKNAAALSHLQRQFSGRKAQKTYIAVVEGKLEPKEALIDAPIARNQSNPQTFSVNAAGRPSQTKYKTLKVFTKDNRTYSLLELKPMTGRTHQLRVHLKYIGHPIVGDAVYGHAGPRLMLHASELELTLPNGEHRLFESRLPDDISNFADL